ncbi:ADM_collapsed_G0004890.mRNA.1.CDS.1 [Saccharomyces cerevisiae]|nr:ADM_collapsed_G0004890.mRNA.1.CDS.1 [Saccharomyces cerevisiae]
MVQNNESVFFVECDSYKESPSTSPIRLDDLDGNDAVSDQGLAFDGRRRNYITSSSKKSSSSNLRG